MNCLWFCLTVWFIGLDKVVRKVQTRFLPFWTADLKRDDNLFREIEHHHSRHSITTKTITPRQTKPHQTPQWHINPLNSEIRDLTTKMSPTCHTWLGFEVAQQRPTCQDLLSCLKREIRICWSHNRRKRNSNCSRNKISNSTHLQGGFKLVYSICWMRIHGLGSTSLLGWLSALYETLWVNGLECW